ncbi:MAG: nicotinamide mononucleotide transporter, partial [Clostridia bacterium]|nr:nicotinamide mononucleotide transporter [Clostridia bacterium]
MLKLRNPFANLTKFEWTLYILSAVTVIATGFFGGGDGVLSTVASFIGVTALIFVAKGDVFGQVLTLVFAVFYGIISYSFHYYGEMITYMCMTAP